MKKLIIILLASAALASCKKEVIAPVKPCEKLTQAQIQQLFNTKKIMGNKN